MLTRCAKPGCETFVLGGFCLEHEQPQTRVFVRGRPFLRPLSVSLTSRIGESPRTLVRTTGGSTARLLDTRPSRVPVIH